MNKTAENASASNSGRNRILSVIASGFAIVVAVIIIAIVVRSHLASVAATNNYNATVKQEEEYKREQTYDYVHATVLNYSPTDNEKIDRVGGIYRCADSYYATYLRYTYPLLNYVTPDDPKAITLFLTEKSYEDLRPKDQPKQGNSSFSLLFPQDDHSDVKWRRDLTIGEVQSLITALDKLPEWKSISEQQSLDVKGKSFFESTDSSNKVVFDASFSYDANSHKAEVCLDFSPYNPNSNTLAPIMSIGNTIHIDYEYVPCLKQMLANAMAEFNAKYEVGQQAYQALQKSEATDRENKAKVDALLK
jgi:hypothetical protein